MLLYHVNRHLFTEFTMPKECDPRNGHLNGVLGRWFTFVPRYGGLSASWVGGSGYLYTVYTSQPLHSIPLDTFRQWADDDNNDPAFYLNLRKKFLDAGTKLLAVREQDNAHIEFVALDAHILSIRSSTHITD